MNILFVDPIIGISGDMIIAALIDLGVDIDYLKEKLKFIGKFRIVVNEVVRQGVSGLHLKFEIKERIEENQFIPLIMESSLPKRIKNSAKCIINRIFEAEKKVHHLHKLADADTLLDIIGTLVAIDYLKVARIYSRPVKAGQGFIHTKEGNMPAFSCATAELLRGFPVEFLPIGAELTTSTGAAILTTIAEPVDEFSFSKLAGIGIGAGKKDLKDYPNILRIFLGKKDDLLYDECLVLETNIDDMNPQDYELLINRLFSAGALDVFMTSIIMKNSRPGILLTILCEKNQSQIFDVLFNESTTLGIRYRSCKRLKLKRKIKKFKTPYGELRVKFSKYREREKFSLEYQDLKRIATKENLPLEKLRAELTKIISKRIK